MLEQVINVTGDLIFGGTHSVSDTDSAFMATVEGERLFFHFAEDRGFYAITDNMGFQVKVDMEEQLDLYAILEASTKDDKISLMLNILNAYRLV